MPNMTEYEHEIVEAKFGETRKSRMTLFVSIGDLEERRISDRRLDVSQVDHARTMQKGETLESIARKAVSLPHSIIGLRYLEVLSADVEVEGRRYRSRIILNSTGVGFIDGEMVDISNLKSVYGSWIATRNGDIVPFYKATDFIISTGEEDQAPK